MKYIDEIVLGIVGITLLILTVSCTAPVDPAPEPVQKKFSTGYIKPKDRNGTPFVRNKSIRAPFPDSFSWAEKGFGTPVRSQGNCGSCWAFGSTQQIEMGYKIFAHKDIDFSEQDLVGRLYYGCGGGDIANDDQVKRGQLAESDCPYRADDSRCPSSAKPAGKGISWGMIGQQGRPPTDDEMKTAITAYGAVAVTLGADDAFMNYHGGFPTECYQSGTNHLVALEGWKVVNGKTYFHLKNSWGTSWGEKGYGWFPLGCWSLADEAAYLAVDAVPCKPPAQKLPALYSVAYNDTVVLAVKAVQGTTYEWFQGQTKLGEGNELEITVKEEMTVTLKEHNQCGDSDVQTVVSVKP